MRSVELFAGAGGLALGGEAAGLHPEVVVEWDRWACDTVRDNKAAGYPLVGPWRVHMGDVRDVDWSSFGDLNVDVVTGGPPCQPFSMGGKARAADDNRDMFPAAINVIRTLRPKAFVLENVRGLTRTAFANYFSYIQLSLRYPELVARDGEIWSDHYHRLQAEHTTAGAEGLQYNVVSTLVNAADYGVPQQRHRVFLVGFRSDLDAEWSFPEASHSYEALLHDQWVSGDYWERHKVAKKDREPLNPRLANRVKALHDVLAPSELGNPWSTVRDAISDMPKPTVNGSRKFRNHELQLGARAYPGHTGSPIDMPSKTLKAGAHGVPGGENMLRQPDGSIRYFTVRESARLQTFPDNYELHGAWGEAMRQLGNAVPVLLAQKVVQSVTDHLQVADMRHRAAKRWNRESA